MGRLWLDFHSNSVDVRCSEAGSLGLKHTPLVSLNGLAADEPLGLVMGQVFGPQLGQLAGRLLV
jgi:hypothetical protein